VEALPPQPSEEEIPAFGAEEKMESLPPELFEKEVKPVKPSETSAEEVGAEKLAKKEETLSEKRVPPEEAIPEGMELVLKAYEEKRGNCLQEIANQYYGDPSLWRKIWAYNKYIKDPNWIFPGDDLIIPTYSEVVKVTEEKPQEPEVKLEELEQGAGYERDIFIAPPDFRFDGCIAGVKEKKFMTACGDIVFIDLGKSQQVKPKTRYAIYREKEEVIHPRTGEVMGIMVEKIGVLEVTSDIEENSSTAVIIDSRKPIEIGDSIKLQMKPKQKEIE
jgi:hypothetical protein